MIHRRLAQTLDVSMTIRSIATTVSIAIVSIAIVSTAIARAASIAI
jgi:hypothetical protein|tara:strand:+ start:1505 stop:1642 length:138 start_codon:yes stop_codon:yes gene_type:complete